MKRWNEQLVATDIPTLADIQACKRRLEEAQRRAYPYGVSHFAVIEGELIPVGFSGPRK